MELRPNTVEVFDMATCEMTDLPAPNDGLLEMDPNTGDRSLVLLQDEIWILDILTK